MRKNVFLGPVALKRAQSALLPCTELVAFRDEVLGGFDKVAGQGPDFGGTWALTRFVLLKRRALYTG